MRARLFVVIVIALGFIGASSHAQNVTTTIAFTSTRANPPTVPPILGGEIYFIHHLPDGSFSVPQRVTNNAHADTFPALSPDGRGTIVFDSNRLRTGDEPVNTSDLFLMNHDGTEQVFLTRGGSPTWSPAGPSGKAPKRIAFHASASGAGLPINPFPGSATSDSDILTVNVDHLLEHGERPRNLTSNRVETVDDDPNWSPDGRHVVFTSYIIDPSTTETPAQIFMMKANGSGQEQLTFDAVEKRGPAWSPDGRRILFACRVGPANAAGLGTFEICVMDAVANAPFTRLTTNNQQDLTPTWSPDGLAIVFHRGPANQLWVMNADGTGQIQLTASTGNNLLATSWGVIQEGQRPK